jgi:hypothetical protein
MVGSSVAVWQVMQPADLRSASSSDCPRNGRCRSSVAWDEVTRKPKERKSNEIPAKDRTTLNGLFEFENRGIVWILQNRSFAKPKTENCVRPV